MNFPKVDDISLQVADNIDNTIKRIEAKGIASDFIKYLAAQRFNNAVAIQLEVTPNNDKAIKLYEKLGFTQYKNNLLFLNRGD